MNLSTYQPMNLLTHEILNRFLKHLVPELQPGEVLTVFDAEEQEDVIPVKHKDLKCKERTSPMSVVEDVHSVEDQCTPVELDRSPPRIRRRLSVFSF